MKWGHDSLKVHYALLKYDMSINGQAPINMTNEAVRKGGYQQADVLCDRTAERAIFII
jgi:hypothetical protein